MSDISIKKYYTINKENTKKINENPPSVDYIINRLFSVRIIKIYI